MNIWGLACTVQQLTWADVGTSRRPRVFRNTCAGQRVSAIPLFPPCCGNAGMSPLKLDDAEPGDVGRRPPAVLIHPSGSGLSDSSPGRSPRVAGRSPRFSQDAVAAAHGMCACGMAGPAWVRAGGAGGSGCRHADCRLGPLAWCSACAPPAPRRWGRGKPRPGAPGEASAVQGDAETALPDATGAAEVSGARWEMAARGAVSRSLARRGRGGEA